MSSQIYYYEPFYNFDRLMDSAFGRGLQQAVQPHGNDALAAAPSGLRPRYVSLPSSLHQLAANNPC